MTQQPRERLLSVAWIAGRLLFWVTAVIYSLELSRRSIVLSDEGCLLSQVTAMLDGKVLYRDIDLFVTPGIWYLLEAVFSITGPQVLVSRWVAAAGLLATMLVSRRIVSEVGGPRWGDLAPLLIAIFSMWAFPAWSTAFYSPWATLFALAGLAAVLTWMRTRRTAWLVACGIGCGLSLVFKQNYGIFAAAGCGLAVALDFALRRPPSTPWSRVAGDVLRAGVPVFAGFLVPIGALVVVLARGDALAPAFDSLLLRPFQGFVTAHSIPYLAFGDLWSFEQLKRAAGFIYRAVPMSVTDVAFRWPSWILWTVDLLHWGLYWIPPTLLAGVGVRTWSRRNDATPADRALAAIALFSAVYFLGVFPRADLNHLVNVYQPILCLAAATAAAAFGTGLARSKPLRTIGAATAAIVLTAYSLLAAAWMNDVRKLFAYPLDSPRGGVLLTQDEADKINHEVAVLRELTAEGEPVFAIAGLSMIPFLAERPMPTRFFNLYSVHIGFDSGASVVREIEESGTKVILAEYENFFADPEGMLSYAPVLTEYLRRTFVPVRSVGGQRHMILTRRSAPLDDVPGVPLDLICRSMAGGPPYAYTREHLLYRSLHHSFVGVWGGKGQTISLCRMLLPSDGRLRVEVEFRQFDAAPEGGIAKADAWIWPDEAGPSQLFSTEWPLLTEIGMDGPAPHEFEVPLSAWAGSTVTVMLRSYLEGDISSPVLDPGRVVVMWNGGSIESPDFLIGPRLPEETSQRSAEGS